MGSLKIILIPVVLEVPDFSMFSINSGKICLYETVLLHCTEYCMLYKDVQVMGMKEYKKKLKTYMTM